MFTSDKFSNTIFFAVSSSENWNITPSRTVQFTQLFNGTNCQVEFGKLMKIYLGNMAYSYSDIFLESVHQEVDVKRLRLLAFIEKGRVHILLWMKQLIRLFKLKDHIKEKNHLQYDSAKNLQSKKQIKEELLIIN